MREADDAARKEAEQAALKRAVVVSIALTLPVVALEMGSHLVPGLHHLIVRTIGMQELDHPVRADDAGDPRARPALLISRVSPRCCAWRRT